MARSDAKYNVDCTFCSFEPHHVSAQTTPINGDGIVGPHDQAGRTRHRETARSVHRGRMLRELKEHGGLVARRRIVATAPRLPNRPSGITVRIDGKAPTRARLMCVSRKKA
jgi:hypothetical protein